MNHLLITYLVSMNRDIPQTVVALKKNEHLAHVK